MESQTIDRIIKADYDFRILILDIALANTGWCMMEFSSVNKRFRIRGCDTIVTEAGGDRSTRVRFILHTITQLILNNSINCVIIEEPPQTVFGKGSANMIKGRATSVFSVVAACYAVIGFCYARGIFCREIQPSQWQAIPAGSNSKTWALKEARKIFEYVKYNRKLKQEDHHVADAVCIGVKVISNFTSKKWMMPTLTELNHE